MYGVWSSVKENMNCGVKMLEVSMPEKVQKRKNAVAKASLARELLVEKKEPADDVIFWRKYGRERFCELERGHTSRNIIEMIFHASLMTPGKWTQKIEKVLKVKNAPETQERFEEYREMVKKRARVLNWRHPRSMVDGNELQMFYATTMTCCPSKAAKLLELCRNSTCGLCQIMRSSFEGKYMKKNGIALKGSIDLSEDDIAVEDVEHMKRAVMVCRVIAGKVANTVQGEYDEGPDSLGNNGELLVKSPNAVLPCFVIVCS